MPGVTGFDATSLGTPPGSFPDREPHADLNSTTSRFPAGGTGKSNNKSSLFKMGGCSSCPAMRLLCIVGMSVWLKPGWRRPRRAEQERSCQV